jgi:hypothetical protein
VPRLASVAGAAASIAGRSCQFAFEQSAAFGGAGVVGRQ